MGGVAKYHSAEKYVFLLLLFTAAVIPVNQVFTLLMVAVTFFAGMAVAVKYRKLKRVPVLPRVQPGAFIPAFGNYLVFAALFGR